MPKLKLASSEEYLLFQKEFKNSNLNEKLEIIKDLLNQISLDQSELSQPFFSPDAFDLEADDKEYELLDSSLAKPKGYYSKNDN